MPRSHILRRNGMDVATSVQLFNFISLYCISFHCDRTKLKRIQNPSARLVSRSKKQNRITHILTESSLAPHRSKNSIKDHAPYIQRYPWFAPLLHLRTRLPIHTYTVHQIFHSAAPASTPTENQNLWRKDFCLQCPNPLQPTPACPPLKQNLNSSRSNLKHIYKNRLM